MKKNKTKKQKVVATLKVIPTKKELENLKTVRQFGVDDLKRYKTKIHANIKVFEDAIEKEKVELKRVQGMIDSLKVDIKDVNRLKKLAND